MNERAEEALANLLTLAVDGIEGAKTFAEAEIPQVVEQLLLWKFWESLIHTLFPLALSLMAGAGALTCLTKSLKAKKTKARDGIPPYKPNFWWMEIGPSPQSVALHMTFGVLTFGFGLITLDTANLTWLQILIAPKLYLLEYSADLIK